MIVISLSKKTRKAIDLFFKVNKNNKGSNKIYIKFSNDLLLALQDYNSSITEYHFSSIVLNLSVEMVLVLEFDIFDSNSKLKYDIHSLYKSIQKIIITTIDNVKQEVLKW